MLFCSLLFPYILSIFCAIKVFPVAIILRNSIAKFKWSLGLPYKYFCTGKWDCSTSTHLTEAPDFDCIQPILYRQGTRKIRKTYGTRPRYASILSTVLGEQNQWWYRCLDEVDFFYYYSTVLV